MNEKLYEEMAFLIRKSKLAFKKGDELLGASLLARIQLTIDQYLESHYPAILELTVKIKGRS